MNAPFRATGPTHVAPVRADYRRHSIGEAARDPAAMYGTSVGGAVSSDAMERRLDELIVAWRRATAWLADPGKIATHPSALALTEFVREHNATRLVVDRLRREPSYLVLIMQQVTGEMPYENSDLGRIGAMAERWVEWQRQRDEIVRATAAE